LLVWLLSFSLLGDAPGLIGALARVSVSFFVLTFAALTATEPPVTVAVPPRLAFVVTSMSLAATAAPKPRREGLQVSQSAATLKLFVASALTLRFAPLTVPPARVTSEVVRPRP